jgi:predicted nucleic acid-binding OB-fold protein
MINFVLSDYNAITANFAKLDNAPIINGKDYHNYSSPSVRWLYVENLFVQAGINPHTDLALAILELFTVNDTRTELGYINARIGYSELVEAHSIDLEAITAKVEKATEEEQYDYWVRFLHHEGVFLAFTRIYTGNHPAILWEGRTNA